LKLDDAKGSEVVRARSADVLLGRTAIGSYKIIYIAIGKVSSRIGGYGSETKRQSGRE
jgi:hypothetical protein